jgi:hypothetical protein
MTTEKLPETPDTTITRAAVREKAQLVRAKQARVRQLRILSIVAAVALVIAGASYGVYQVITDAAKAPVHYPTGLDSDGMRVNSVLGLASEPGVELPPVDPTIAPEDPSGEFDGKTQGGPGEGTTDETAGEEVPASVELDVVDIHIYVDFLSPSSGGFQQTNARQLTGWIVDGAVTVTYHPVAMLTASSNGTRYSLRAAAAAACVASHSPDRVYAFTNDLLVNQPQVNSDGFSDDELAIMAAAAGVEDPKKVRQCIEEQRFVAWAKEATSRALAGPLPGTADVALSAPSMVIANGQVYTGSLDNASEFSKFVQTVASRAYLTKNISTVEETDVSTEK